MAGTRVTTEERDRIVELARTGLSLNQTAKTVGRSNDTVSKICRAAGHTFNRTAPSAAIEARAADTAARLIELRAILVEDARKLEAQLWQPANVYHWDKNQFCEQTLDEPTFGDKQRIMTTVAIAIDKAIAIQKSQEDPGLDEARSMLAGLAAAIAIHAT